tara:strand:- start:162 stop:356 length:195 start_codon:yes stop_codon:yes gene_type:complete
MLYQEATTVSNLNLAMMGVGIALIVGGCALVGKRKTMPKRCVQPRSPRHTRPQLYWRQPAPSDH